MTPRQSVAAVEAYLVLSGWELQTLEDVQKLGFLAATHPLGERI